MKIVAKRHFRHNRVKYVPGQEVPADVFGISISVLKEEIDQLKALVESGAVELIEEKAEVVEELVEAEAPKKAKKAKA